MKKIQINGKEVGLHGIGGDPDVVLDMLELITQNWWKLYTTKGKDKGQNKFFVDKNVSIA